MRYFVDMGRWVIDMWLELWLHVSTVFRNAWRYSFWRFILVSYVFVVVVLITVGLVHDPR